MKIQQENLPFRPITIKLEKKKEAELFYSVVTKLLNCTAVDMTFAEENFIKEIYLDKHRKIII